MPRNIKNEKNKIDVIFQLFLKENILTENTIRHSKNKSLYSKKYNFLAKIIPEI
jgi:hypothetical protein